jgi:carbamoylphosphate synthase large subunit
MAAKFKIGDEVIVPEAKEGAQDWWVGVPAVVRAVFEDQGMYEVLFEDAQDFAFIEEQFLQLNPQKQESKA